MMSFLQKLFGKAGLANGSVANAPTLNNKPEHGEDCECGNCEHDHQHTHEKDGCCGGTGHNCGCGHGHNQPQQPNSTNINTQA